MGRAIRRIREAHGITADELATASRVVGLEWARSTVSTIEAGKRQLQLRELLPLLAAFSEAGATVELQDLFGDPEADLVFPFSDYLTLSSTEIRLAFEGRWAEVYRPQLRTPAKVDERTELIERAARELGVQPSDVTVAAVGNWGKTFWEERERRAAAAILARERRGQETTGRARSEVRRWVTRHLIDEVRLYLQRQQQEESSE